ncbi:MAG: hypothetical protein ACREDR_14725, partial [Blastocatellia bacterium]
ARERLAADFSSGRRYIFAYAPGGVEERYIGSMRSRPDARSVARGLIATGLAERVTIAVTHRDGPGGEVRLHEGKLEGWKVEG